MLYAEHSLSQTVSWHLYCNISRAPPLISCICPNWTTVARIGQSNSVKVYLRLPHYSGSTMSQPACSSYRWRTHLLPSSHYRHPVSRCEQRCSEYGIHRRGRRRDIQELWWPGSRVRLANRGQAAHRWQYMQSIVERILQDCVCCWSFRNIMTFALNGLLVTQYTSVANRCTTLYFYAMNVSLYSI